MTLTSSREHLRLRQGAAVAVLDAPAAMDALGVALVGVAGVEVEVDSGTLPTRCRPRHPPSSFVA